MRMCACVCLFRFVNYYYQVPVIEDDAYYPLIDHLIEVGLKNTDKKTGMIWPSEEPRNFGPMFGESGIVYTLLREVGH